MSVLMLTVNHRPGMKYWANRRPCKDLRSAIMLAANKMLNGEWDKAFITAHGPYAWDSPYSEDMTLQQAEALEGTM